MLSILALSITTFADGISCNDGYGEVRIQSQYVQSNDYGSVTVYISNSASGATSVLIKCYDANTDRVVDTQSYTIPGNSTRGVTFKNVESNHAYYFKIFCDN